jgi:AAA+ ATPase superfamily predicted ATPase
MQQFFPHYTAAERVTSYAIWGGIPAYWERIDQDLSVMENVRVQLLPSNAMMQEEPRILLQDFINDPHNYVGILRAIASGSHAQNEICTFTGLSRGLVSKYLSVLRDTGFVERQVPATETSTDSRRGRYFITDPYLRFYYRFLAAFQARLALGEQQQMLDAIEQNLPAFIQTYTWPDLCREWVLRASARDELPETVEEVGAAWTRSQNLEVAGIDQVEKILVLGACQWDESPTDMDLIRSLLTRINAIVPRDEVWSLYCLGFARRSWPDEATAQADRILRKGLSNDKWRYLGVRLLDLEDVAGDLTRWSVQAG